MKVAQRDGRKMALWASIIVMAFIVILATVIANLMSFGVIPSDWFCFHNYLRHTGGFRLGMFIAPFATFAILSIINRFTNWLTQKSILLITFWLFLSVSLDALGNVFGWFAVNENYGKLWYDNVTHIVGGANATTIMFIIWNNTIKKQSANVSLKYKLAITFFSAVAIGTFYELYEYYSDILLKTQLVGSIEDSLTDIAYNTIGASLAAILLFASHHRFCIIRYNPYKYLTNIDDADSNNPTISPVWLSATIPKTQPRRG